MPRKYEKKIIPFQVLIRMYPEDVARAYEMGLKADDIRVLAPGERMRPSCLWPRPAEADRRRSMLYWIEECGDGMKPIPTGCDAGDVDGAKAAVIRHLVRKGDDAKARLAPEAIAVCTLLDEYLDIAERQFEMGLIRADTIQNYRDGVERLARCFHSSSVMDIVQGGRDKYYAWGGAQKFSAGTMMEDVNTLKRAINWALEARGSAFRVAFWVGMKPTAPRQPFDPDEHDRIMRVLEENIYFNEKLEVVMVVDPETGERVPKRAPLATQRARVPFRRAYPIAIDTHSRPTATLETTWFETNAPRIDVGNGIMYRIAELTPETGEKPRGQCVLSPQLWEDAKDWMEDDVANGFVHVVHDWQGRPLDRLPSNVWATILRHAQVPHRRFYATKQTSFQISLREGIPVHQISERSAVSPETLTGTYALKSDPANQIDAAAAHGAQVNWRRTHALLKQRKADAEANRKAREARLAADPPPRPRKEVVRPVRAPGKYAPRKAPAVLAEEARRKGLRKSTKGAAPAPEAGASNVIRLADRRRTDPRRR
ncbi:MAG TPA: hypothetical protein VIF34_11365 [Methylocystis sp.]|jgi:hypothetical protein